MFPQHVLHFPHWLTLAHFVNFLFITILMRSGIQILMDHPRLYLNEDCTRGGEWIRFTKKIVPTDRPYTAREDSTPINSWIALPGHKEGEKHGLGIGRHWHFFSVVFWVLNGLIYITLLFTTDNWRRLIPTSWAIIPEAWHVFIGFITFNLPSETLSNPYNPLQQLAYAAVVFVLAPVSMFSGALLSPAIWTRFPVFAKIFKGRQVMRTVHFLALCAFGIFLIIHVTLVILTGFARNMSHMALGEETIHPILGPATGILGITLVIGIHVLITKWSNKNPRQVQNSIGEFTNKIIRKTLGKLTSRQVLTEKDISPYHWVNGYPPKTEEWLKLKEDHFCNYRLKVKGLVENPLELSLEEIKNLPFSEQITTHYCIQGWTGTAKWGGVRMTELIKLCKPLKEAKYVVFDSYQFDPDQKRFYGIIEIQAASQPQVILAYKMNDADLPVEYGAPLRLRVENQLGYKMVKWIDSIEFVESYAHLGLGQGGYREDVQFFCIGAHI